MGTIINRHQHQIDLKSFHLGYVQATWSPKVSVPVVENKIDLRTRWGQLMGMPWFYKYWDWLATSDPKMELVKCRDTCLKRFVCLNMIDCFGL